jgi:DNA-binding MarR family transcriptional regulator
MGVVRYSGMAADFVPGSNVFFRFFRTGQTIRRLMLIAVDGSGVTGDEYGVLSAVRALGITLGERGAPAPVQPTEMANWLGMPATTVSTYVARFLERGLVERRPHPSDGRSYVLALTAEGDELVDGVARRLTAIVDQVAAESDAELADIAHGLRLLDEAGRRVLDSERASL